MTTTPKHFLKEADYTPAQWRELVDLAARLKAEHREGREEQRLTGKAIALIFEKTSTRTRCAFEVAAFQQGAHTTYLDTHGSQIGHKESLADTARVLSQMYDGIEMRGNSQTDLETLAEYASVPVFNGLTDQWHPTQMLADALTIKENVKKDFSEVTHAYLGDARFNTGRSLLVSSAMLGMDVRIIAPREYQPDKEARAIAAHFAELTGARITITNDVEAVEGADAISTDIWVSMGEDPAVWRERIAALAPYAVTSDLMKKTGNPDAIFMHCLPAFHDLGTTIGREIYEMTGMESLEVSNQVFEGAASRVFEQAGNRMHTIKAVLVNSLAR